MTVKTELKLYVSPGNSKIGPLLNLSMTPIKSCVPNVPCGVPEEGKKRSKCYADKSYQQYPNVRKAWDGNYDFFMNDPIGFEVALMKLLSSKKSVPYFRYFVGGDIPNFDFLKVMCRIAKKYPDTKFLSFTKRYGYVERYICGFAPLPSNMFIRLSAWPDFPMINHQGLATAWLKDPNLPDDRIPENAFTCQGSCKTCKFCWSNEVPVVFEVH